MAKSIIKWAGGKTIILSKIKERLDRIEKKNSAFYDLFAGGGSVCFEFSPLFKNAYINDTNQEIINVFRVLKKYPDELLNLLIEYQKNHSKEFYYYIRGLDRKSDYDCRNDIEKAARTVYLNKTCYNGLYRVNSKGQFNVPIGKQKNIKIYDKNVFFEIHKKLQCINIENHDYSVILKKCKSGDVVYFDPPYDKISKQSFIEYNVKKFDKYDQERLLEDIDELTKKGVFVIASNSYTERTLELYKKYIVKESIIQVRRVIGANGTSRNSVYEILIDNISMVKDYVDKNKKT